MKILLIALVLIAAAPQPALASTASLARQVKALNARVTAQGKLIEDLRYQLVNVNQSATIAEDSVNELTLRVETQQHEITNLRYSSICAYALTWDGIGMIYKILTGTDAKQVPDNGACFRVGVTRGGNPFVP